MTRIQSPDDERSITVSLTRRRTDCAREGLPGHITVLDDLLFAPLSGADIETLADILGRTRDHMRRTPPRSAAPRRRKKPAGTRPAVASRPAVRSALEGAVHDAGD
ncbi:hypothetical protein AB0E69_07040 [Kribbella sp. NPDC026611]|uniref:hypothetical protein n=1 Tax=Kribbella sp. NPDC026611 TaxID=3154911 RepID=UPI0033E75D1C